MKSGNFICGQAVYIVHFAVFCIALNSCGTQSARQLGLPSKIQTLAREAVFEVLVKKPPEDARFIYDRALDFSALPLSERSLYAAVGTAFAVSPSEALTAFHVINPASKSAVYDKYYIRAHSGGKEEIYEIENITRASNELDFVFFTVRGKKFSIYFETSDNFIEGENVYGIGNAFGEGIITQSGAILGTSPEEKNGSWNYIKTSVPANPGNSGGPLVNKNGKALGVLSYTRGAILYSSPFNEINSFSKNKLKYSLLFDYSHLILPNRIRREFNCELELPLPYSEVSDLISSLYITEYKNAITELFENAPLYLYGEKNNALFDDIPSAPFPQIDFADGNDGEWKIGAFDVRKHKLDGERTLYSAEAGGFDIFYIYETNDSAPFFLNTDVKKLMDDILKIISIKRTLTRSKNLNDDYRILSFGEPFKTNEHRDKLGRLWIQAEFLLPFDDMYFTVFVLPAPGGPVLLSAFCTSAALSIFEYDMKIILDHIHSVYSAPFEKWREFLEIKKWTPDFLKDFAFEYNSKEKTVSLKNQTLQVNLDNKVFDWSPRSELSLAYTWQKTRDGIDYKLCALGFDKDGTGIDTAAVLRTVKTNSADGWSFHIQRGKDNASDGVKMSNDAALRLNALKAGVNILRN